MSFDPDFLPDVLTGSGRNSRNGETEVEIHEVCAVFPMMTTEEFGGLKADIAAHGQREPIWTHEGRVIDGRNRLKACQELGIDPVVREWDGNGSLVEFVVSLNFHRRHLTSGQKAACGVDVEAQLAVEAKAQKHETVVKAGKRSGEVRKKKSRDAQNYTSERKSEETSNEVQRVEPSSSEKAAKKSITKAAKLVGSNRQYVHDAKTVAEKSPELIEKVKKGEITLPQAKREVQRAQKREKLNEKAIQASQEPDTSRWEIQVGDCVEWMGKTGPGSARLVFADPPYNIGIDYGEGHDDRMPAPDYLAWTEIWVQAAARLLTPDGSLWVLISDEWADEVGCILRRAGLTRRSWIKWYESFGVNNANNFNRCSRHLFYMVKDPKQFVFDADHVSRPSDRQTKYKDSRADPGGKVWDNVWGIKPPIPRLVENSAERLPDFPTQLPLDLLLAVVGCASEPGDLVIDPFSGSGTTGAASIRLGRRYLGFELSESFAALSRLRLSAERMEPCLST